MCMDLGGIVPSGASETEKDKCHMMSLTCGTQGTEQTTQQNTNKLIEAEKI